ncbi:hypothetical protein EsH8_VIII_000303 [Colletotrichum jinshuiense]
MPALQLEAANMARDIAHTLVSRVTTSRGRSRTRVRAVGGGIIAAIVIGAIVFIAIVVLAFCLLRRRKRRTAMRQQEMQKHYGDNRSSIGTNNTAPQGYGNHNQGYNYNQGQGYGYAHTAQPGQAGYGAQQTGGVPPMAPAHTANHVTK